MDPQQFDALTRHLISASAGSRRRVLTALVAGAFGRLLVPQRIDEVAASCSAFNVQCAAKLVLLPGLWVALPRWSLPLQKGVEALYGSGNRMPEPQHR